MLLAVRLCSARGVSRDLAYKTCSRMAPGAKRLYPTTGAARQVTTIAFGYLRMKKVERACSLEINCSFAIYDTALVRRRPCPRVRGYQSSTSVFPTSPLLVSVFGFPKTPWIFLSWRLLKTTMLVGWLCAC